MVVVVPPPPVGWAVVVVAVLPPVQGAVVVAVPPPVGWAVVGAAPLQLQLWLHSFASVTPVHAGGDRWKVSFMRLDMRQ